MLYKLNIPLNEDILSESESESEKEKPVIIKQDSSDIVSDNIDIDIFDIGGS